MANQQKKQEIRITKTSDLASENLVRDLVGRLLMKELQLSPLTGGMLLSIMDDTPSDPQATWKRGV